MEKNLEQQFGKLTQQAKSSITALEDKIRDLESQIQTLKQAATKIDLLAQKIQELLPKIMAAVGTDPGGALRRTPSTKEDQLAAQLRAELAGLGAGASSDQVSKIVDALAKGGSGGMALATQIVTRIAEARSKQIDGQINSAAAAIKPQVDQVSALEKQLAKLDQDKARALADLRTQRGKALADAAKAQDARLAIPTSIPTPKKP
jgi:hypothetical protein